VALVLYGLRYPGNNIFDKAALTTPPNGQPGDFGRNVPRGFGASQIDFAVQRQFPLSEKRFRRLIRWR
jgi:hypothetical protein